jgi:peroxiredoxin
VKHRYVILIFALFFMLAGCKQPGPDSGSSPSVATGERMQIPAFRLPSLTDNTMVDTAELKGRVLLLTFFATWCPPCIQEIPTLNDLQQTFQKKGFTVLGLSVDEGGTDLLLKLIEKYEIAYPVVLADPDLARAFGGISGIPVTFLTNRQGEIVKKYLGYVGHDVLEGDIKKMLAEG